jgi:hypothetical protein
MNENFEGKFKTVFADGQYDNGANSEWLNTHVKNLNGLSGEIGKCACNGKTVTAELVYKYFENFIRLARRL